MIHQLIKLDSYSLYFNNIITGLFKKLAIIIIRANNGKIVNDRSNTIILFRLKSKKSQRII